MTYFIDIMGLLGLALLAIAHFNKNKQWSIVVRKIANILLISYILIQTGRGSYDGWMGNPRR